MIIDDDSKKKNNLGVNFCIGLSQRLQDVLLLVFSFAVLVLQINWVALEYTVREEDEMVEVCARLTGTYAGSRDSRPTLDVMTIEDSAREGIGKCPLLNMSLCAVKY